MADLAIAIKIATEDQSSGPISKIKGALGGLGEAITSPAKAMGGLVSGLGSLGMAVGGLGMLAQGIGSVAAGMVSGNAQMETYQTQLGTLMGSADLAKERIAQLAKIGADTPFDLPQLVASEKIMMGFGLTTEKTMKLTGQTMDQYRTSMGDMAAGTGADLTEVTNLWAKFGSGATGESLARLQELGIVTKEQLADVGVQFSKSGELLSPLPQAMEAAMKIANGKFGGGMKALSSTFEGQMSTLGDNFNQAKVLLMAPIFDVLKSGLGSLNDMLSSETFTSTIKSMAETGAAAIGTLIEVFGEMSAVFQGASFVGLTTLLDEWFPPGVTDGIVDMVTNLSEVFDSVFAGDIPGILDGVLGTIEGFGMVIVGAVESWATSFASWVDGADSGMMDGAAELETNLLGWLIDTAALIVEKLAVWAGAFVDWIGPKIPGMLEALGRYVTAVTGWMLTIALPFILEKLVQWGSAFVEWVAPRIPPLLLALGGLLLELGTWIVTTALPAIVSKLLEWGSAFAAWVPGALVGLLFELGKLEVELILWVGKQVADIVLKLGEWAGAFLGWIAKDVIPTLPDKLGAILVSIAGWVTDKVVAVATSVQAIGGGILTGIQDGISGALSGFWSWLQTNFVDKIPTFVRDLLNIHSPSGVFADIGRNIVDGLRVGMEGRLPSIEQVVSRLVGTIATTGEVTDWLKAAMSVAGVGSDWLPGLQRLVGWESSGNPGAVNSISVGGQHATGLLQTLPSTFRGYALPGMGDITNPIHNAAAAIRYILDTYGTVYNIPGISDGDRGKFPGYATGGIAWTPQLAHVAEREPELIIPLSRVRSGAAAGNAVGGIGRDELDRLADRIAAGVRQTRPIILQGTSEELLGKLRREQHRESLLHGPRRLR